MLSALAAIVAFPILTLILFGLTKVEAALSVAASLIDHRAPAEPAAAESPSD